MPPPSRPLLTSRPSSSTPPCVSLCSLDSSIYSLIFASPTYTQTKAEDKPKEKKDLAKLGRRLSAKFGLFGSSPKKGAAVEESKTKDVAAAEGEAPKVETAIDESKLGAEAPKEESVAPAAAAVEEPAKVEEPVVEAPAAVEEPAKVEEAPKVIEVSWPRAVGGEGTCDD